MSKDHGAGDGGVAVKEHPFAGHGDAGEMAAPVAAGFGDEEDSGVSQPEGEVVFEVRPSDVRALFDFILIVVVCPGIEGVFTVVLGKVVDKRKYPYQDSAPLSLSWIPSFPLSSALWLL